MKTVFAIFALSLLVVAAQMPQLPTPPAPKPVYFAVTAVDTNGTESGFSNEIEFTNGACLLNWNAAPVADHYKLHWGFASRDYAHVATLGNVTNQVFPIPAPPSVVDLVLTFKRGADLKHWTTNSLTVLTISNLDAQEYFCLPANALTTVRR